MKSWQKYALLLTQVNFINQTYSQEKGNSTVSFFGNRSKAEYLNSESWHP